MSVTPGALGVTWLLPPILATCLAVVLMFRVIGSDSTDRSVTERAGALRVAAARLSARLDRSTGAEATDRAGIERDITAVESALHEAMQVRYRVSVGSGAEYRPVETEIERIGEQWSRTRPALLAWVHNRRPLPAGLADSASGLSLEVLLLERQVESLYHANQALNFMLVCGLLLLQLIGLIATGLAKIFDMQRLARSLREITNLSLVTEHTNSSVLLCGADARVRWANGGFLRTSGWNADKVKGQHALLLVADGYEDGPGIAELRAATATGEAYAGELELHRRDGQACWVDLELVPLQSESDGPPPFALIFSDVTERVMATRQLEASDARFRSALGALNEGFLLLDSEGGLLQCNEEFERITGYSREQVAAALAESTRGGSPPLGILRAVRKDGAPLPRGEDPVASTLTTGRRCDNVLFGIHRPTGELRWVSANTAAFELAGSGRPGVVATLADVTDRRRVEEELSRAREAALAAAHTKNEFLQNMSHELRTPLNGVLGMSELLLQTPLDGEQRADLLQMRRSAEDLLTVITHLFDFAHIEAGGSTRESLPFRLRGCIREVESSLASAAESRGLRWSVTVDDGLTDERTGDPGALRQVLLCLASNAVKFTERGEVSLRVRGESGAGDRPRLRFEMRDSGIGIARERQAEIFEAFRQVDGSSTRKYGGIGLGLALAAQLVRQLRGSLDVESEPGKGSLFSFVIPLDVAGVGAVPPPKPAIAVPGGPPLTGQRVVVVVDRVAARSSTRAALERAGASVDVAASADGPGAAAQALGRGQPCRALVLDQRDGGLDGFGFIARVREACGGTLPPTILLTSAGERGDAARCRELGIAGYLASPAGDIELIEAIRRLASVHSPDAPLVTRHLLREGQVERRVLLVEDNAVNRRVASRLLERSGYSVVTAVHGGEAVEQFRKGGWDIVLMDIQMPEMDGLEATRRIRELERAGGLPRTPILAVTAHTLDSDRRVVLEAGMDDLVPKPIVADHLLLTMERYFANAPGIVPIAPGPPALADVLDWNEALERVDGDGEFLEQLLRIFLDDSGNMMQRLEEARSSGDAYQLERAAHGLKGASSTISARHVAPLAREVEELSRAGKLNEARDRFDDLRLEMQRLTRALEILPPSKEEKEAA